MFSPESDNILNGMTNDLVLHVNNLQVEIKNFITFNA